MDENTQSVIESDARHAQREVEGLLGNTGDPAHVWGCLEAALARLHSIERSLKDAGYARPS